jgi:hypothetical protein
MAEILLRVKDKINSSPYLNAQCTKRGDVIVVCPDGWRWGFRELDDPQYRVVCIPQMSVSEAQAFVVGEMETSPQPASMLRHRRAFRLDLEHPSLPESFQTWLADDTRTVAVWTLDLPLETLRALKQRKPPLEDPGVFE